MKGEHHPNSTMTEAVVRQVWDEVMFQGFTRAEAARRWDVGVYAIRHLCQGNSWLHLDLPQPTEADKQEAQRLRRGRLRDKRIYQETYRWQPKEA